MIYAIDFDGTLCFDEFPAIGAPRPDVLDFAKRVRRAGDRLILWTCRHGAELSAAVDWCKAHGLEFDAINDNLPDQVARYGKNCRKVYADYYIDDRALELDMVGYYSSLAYGDCAESPTGIANEDT